MAFNDLTHEADQAQLSSSQIRQRREQSLTGTTREDQKPAVETTVKSQSDHNVYGEALLAQRENFIEIRREHLLHMDKCFVHTVGQGVTVDRVALVKATDEVERSPNTASDPGEASLMSPNSVVRFEVFGSSCSSL